MYPSLVHKHVGTRQPSAKKKLAAEAVTKKKKSKLPVRTTLIIFEKWLTEAVFQKF
jgi:hypothetical protein